MIGRARALAGNLSAVVLGFILFRINFITRFILLFSAQFVGKLGAATKWRRNEMELSMDVCEQFIGFAAGTS